MDGHFGGGFADAMAGGSFGDRGTFEAGFADEIAGPLRYEFQHGFEIATVGGVGAVVVREDRSVVFEGNGGADGVAADVIDEFVVSDRVEPGGEGTCPVIG